MVHGTLVALLLALPLVACRRSIDDSQLSREYHHELPHSSFVEVAPGVRLEVLEWGTKGPPLVLLAGATQTAHVYEEFAPYFTDHFRVVGITRRRHGASDAPDATFGITDLGQDIIAVLDALSIKDALFMAHSFGGAELSYVAVTYPDRVRKMVFLDGATDFYEAYNTDGWLDGWPDVALDARDKASPQAVASHFARVWGVALPLNEILASHRFDADGKLVALYPNIGSMFEDLIKPSLKPLTYTRFNKPTLVVRAIPNTVADLFGGYASYDSDNQRRAETSFRKWQRVVIPLGDRFLKEVPGAQELRIEGGNHLVINAHAGKMLAGIRAFLLK